jgi:GNAT superfamily N-acetyltransferase
MQGHLATVDETEGVVRTLAEAFYADPVWGWAFDDDSRRIDQHSAWFRLCVNSGILNGAVWTTPAFEAVSVWVRPGYPELTPDDEAQLKPTIEESTGDRAAVIFAAFDRFDAMHPHETEHYYLSLLATRPQDRGHGHGMRLLAENLSRIDDEGAAAYLESTNPANVKRYQAVGFELTSSYDLPDGGPTVDQMWRSPR